MNQRLSSLYECFNTFSHFGVTVNDEKGAFLYVNDCFSRMVGYDVSELLGQSYTVITHPDDCKKNIELDQLLRDEVIPFFQIKKRYIHKNGQIRKVLLQVTMNKKENGCFDSYLAVVTDISDIGDETANLQGMGGDFNHALSALPEELRHLITSYELIERYKQKNIRKSNHIKHIVHELRTPLNIMCGLAARFEKMLSNESDPRLKKSAKMMESSSSRMNNLVSEILDVEMLETGSFSILPAKLNLAEVLTEIVEQLQPLAIEHKLILETAFERGRESLVFGDRSRLIMVFTNLISNGLKYTEEGSVSVDIELNKNDGYFEVAIKDTGIGVSKEDLLALFDEYKKIRPQLKKGVDSVGLGLPIAKKIVELHAGEIKVTSEVGKGSEFCVRLPQLK